MLNEGRLPRPPVDTSPALEAGGRVTIWPGETLVYVLSLSAGRLADPSPRVIIPFGKTQLTVLISFFALY